jgi:hypothetical protein
VACANYYLGGAAGFNVAVVRTQRQGFSSMNSEARMTEALAKRLAEIRACGNIESAHVIAIDGSGNSALVLLVGAAGETQCVVIDQAQRDILH